MSKDATSKRFYIPEEPPRILPCHLNDILEFCSTHDASDITIQTGECIIVEIYGLLYPITRRRLNSSEVNSLINEIYGSNAVTQILSGHDIDTHYDFKINRYERCRFRVNATACLVEGNTGIQITLRSIPTFPLDISTLDLPQDIMDNIAPHDGCIYVAGATGSGKSTLLSSIIKYIAEQPDCHRKILTYESPIEFVYDSIEKTSCVISQSEIPLHLPSFAHGVRNALRRKPRLILVGECRDEETISAVVEAALTGHPVYTTVHTNGVAETVRRLVGSLSGDDRDGSAIDIIDTLRLIIWQMLVPTVDGKRTALREYLVFNEKIRDKILEDDIDNITDNVRKALVSDGAPITVEAEKKYREGIISARTYDLLMKQSKQR